MNHHLDSDIFLYSIYILPYFKNNLMVLIISYKVFFGEGCNEYNEHSCNYYSSLASHCDEIMELWSLLSL